MNLVPSRAVVALLAAVTLTSCAPASTAEPAAHSGYQQARTELAALPTQGRAPKTGYTRNQFGQRWSDDCTVAGCHDGCDTRNNVLARDLHDVVTDPRTHNCVVLSGVLEDPYTGRTITFRRGASTSDDIQIDHVVALSDAWQTGAQQLTAAQRRDLANDPDNLLAVDGPTNQRKGDADAATWLPRTAFRCDYIARQILVKTRYRLWVTPPERDAMTTVLATC